MKGRAFIPVVVAAMLTLLVPSPAASGDLVIVYSCKTIKDVYLVGELVTLGIDSTPGCYELTLDWGDATVELAQSAGQFVSPPQLFGHAYTKPGIYEIRAVGKKGCVGVSASHVQVVPAPPPSGPVVLCLTPQIKNIYGPASEPGGGFSAVMPSLGGANAVFFITGCGFGNQKGEVWLQWSKGGSPEKLIPYVWTERAISFQVPGFWGVQDQTAQLVVKVPSPGGFKSSAPFSVPFVAHKVTKKLLPEDVLVTCGPATSQCQWPGSGWTMFAVKQHPLPPWPQANGTDWFKVHLENGWGMKKMEQATSSPWGATFSSPTGFSAGATNATISVAYSLPVVKQQYGPPTFHGVSIEIEGPAGVPHKGSYSGKIGYLKGPEPWWPLWKGAEALDVTKVLDDLDVRLRALERREGEPCRECAERRLTVLALRAALGAARKEDKIYEALVRHAGFLTQEADRMEARLPGTARSRPVTQPEVSAPQEPTRPGITPKPERQAADEAARDLDALAKRLMPLQQDREAQLLLRDIQALQRELAASLQPGEVDRLLRDTKRLTRETDRLEASLRREQQRAAAASPAPSAPAMPEAPAPGSQPGTPSGPPQIAAVPRPAVPARDPVAEEAAKELETLARRLTALGANPEAQRLLREVQLLQRQLNGDQGQAPAVLRDAQRLGREVDRLEASLRQPAPPARRVR